MGGEPVSSGVEPFEFLFMVDGSLSVSLDVLLTLISVGEVSSVLGWGREIIDIHDLS